VIDLLDVRIPVTHLMPQSPGHEQALAAKVFYLDHHGIKRAPAPKVVHLNRHDLAPRIFHLNRHVIWQSLAPDRFSSELR
jgi:hypothetical protein